MSEVITTIPKFCFLCGNELLPHGDFYCKCGNCESVFVMYISTNNDQILELRINNYKKDTPNAKG